MQSHKSEKIRDVCEIILENGTILNVPELFVLDFDGADGISYRNAELNISVDDITVAASLEAETQTIRLSQLNDNANGVFYITSADAARLQLPADFSSTIYVGDTDDLDVLGGAFSGIAETTGAAAASNKADNGNPVRQDSIFCTATDNSARTTFIHGECPRFSSRQQFRKDGQRRKQAISTKTSTQTK